MDLIKPTCRAALSERDYAFLLNAFGIRSGDDCAFASLIADAESLDVLLDDETLFHQLLESPEGQDVSLKLYFYILLRHILKEAGVDDRDIADYLAAMLTAFQHAARLSDYRSGHGVVPECLADLESVAQSFGESGSFYIRVYMGNFSLLMTGMFPQRVRYRRKRWGAPGLRYYSGIGRNNFQWAGSHRLAQQEGLSELYHFLGNEFDCVQSALQELGDRFLFLHQPS